MLSPQDAGDAATNAQFAKAMALTGAEFLEAVEYISNVRLFLASYFPATAACGRVPCIRCRPLASRKFRLLVVLHDTVELPVFLCAVLAAGMEPGKGCAC